MYEKSSEGGPGPGSGFCSHGNLPASCAACAEARQEAETKATGISNQLERVVSFESVEKYGQRLSAKDRDKKTAELIAQAKDLRQQAGLERDGGAPDFFEAVMIHEGLNLDIGRFQKFAANEANSRFDKDLRDLSRNEYDQICADFADWEEIERDENRAIDDYRKSAKEWWQCAEGTDTFDAQVLQNGLEVRQAVRNPDKQARKEKLGQLQNDLAGVIESLGTFYADNRQKLAGRRPEYQLLYIINSLIQKKGLEHVVAIEHTLPRDDRKFGLDFTLSIGDQQYSLDLKALADDSYREEHQDRTVQKAQAKAAQSGGSVIKVAPDVLRAAYQEATAGKAGRNSRQVIEVIVPRLQEESSDFLLQLTGDRKKEGRASAAVSKRQLSALFTVREMMGHGLLSATGDTGAIDMSQVNAIREQAIKQARKRKVSQEDLGDQEATQAVVSEILEDIKRAQSGSQESTAV